MLPSLEYLHRELLGHTRLKGDHRLGTIVAGAADHIPTDVTYLPVLVLYARVVRGAHNPPIVIDLHHEVALLVHIQLAGRKELVEHRALLEVFVARRLRRITTPGGGGGGRGSLDEIRHARDHVHRIGARCDVLVEPTLHVDELLCVRDEHERRVSLGDERVELGFRV